MTDVAIRPARPEDAVICAAIKNDWIDGQDWMPRVHPKGDMERHYRESVFPHREVLVAGEPVVAFLALDRCEGEVTALFVRETGQGIGKALLDRAKSGAESLELWSFVANEGACRFYEREGFQAVLSTSGDNEEGLPDVLYRWDRAPIRRATRADLPHCARVVSDWVERTDWMPRIFSVEEIEALMEEVFDDREIFLIGEPCDGYLSLNPETGQIGALYLDHPGRGQGRALLDRAKSGRTYLQLWTHEPNLAAHRFYDREGFRIVERNPAGNDGLPELRMEWRR